VASVSDSEPEPVAADDEVDSISCGCPDAAMWSICCCSRCCQALQVPTNRSCQCVYMHVLQDSRSSNKSVVACICLA
jgi:hypothetical protein